MKKKIKKLKGGGMDASQADFNTPSASGPKGGPPGVGDRGMNYNKPPTKTPDNSPKTTGGGDVPFKAPLPNIGPLSVAINVGSYLNYKGRQKFARKEGLYRDHYKTTGKTLQPNSPAGKSYVKEAGYGKTPQTPPDRGGPEPIIPKPVTPTATAAKPRPGIGPVMPYYMGFDFQKAKPFKRGGLSGGKRFGPPPKKGPNSHGKCPFRPDGIRGVGAVQKGRGVKFVGVK